MVRKNADKTQAMKRIRRIHTPILHIGRERDHLQGIFMLAHEWMVEAGKDSTWVSFDHPSHGYPYIYRKPDGIIQAGADSAAGVRHHDGFFRPASEAPRV